MKRKSLFQDSLNYFKKRIWPVRVDRYASADLNALPYDEKVTQLIQWLNANPIVKAEFDQIKIPNQPEAQPLTDQQRIEKVRFFGPKRVQSFFVGSLVRHSLKLNQKKRDFMQDPFSYSALLNRIIQDDGAEYNLKLEVATLLELYEGFLQNQFETGQSAEANRARRQIGKFSEDWNSFWKKIKEQEATGSLDQKSSISIFKCKILLDLGKSCLIYYDEQSTQSWKQSEKNKDRVSFSLWREVMTVGLPTTLTSTIWSTALPSWSKLGTILRLLIRPWRNQHQQLKENQRRIISYLNSSLEARGGL